MRLALTALTLLLALPAAAQRGTPVEATTEDGREILVYPDGTWEPVEVIEDIVLDLRDVPPPPPAPPPPAAPLPPLRESSGERTLMSASGDYLIAYDADRWQTSQNVLNPESEFEFQLPFGAGGAVTIYEVLPATLETLRQLVLSNAQSASRTPVKVVSEKAVDLGRGEARRLEYEVVTDVGFEITFITTIVTTNQGILQLLAWTSSELIDQYRDELLVLHDGLVLLDGQ